MIDGLLAALVLVSPRSGLYGKVVIDPARPICVAGVSCSAPDANDLLTFVRRGRRVATTRTRIDGTFRIALAPGRYAVRARRAGAIGRGLEPAHALVPRARYARVNFTLDLGIR